MIIKIQWVKLLEKVTECVKWTFLIEYQIQYSYWNPFLLVQSNQLKEKEDMKRQI